MCGIAGLFDQTVNIDQLKNQAKQMSDKLEHRGPDSSGVWCSKELGVALSHRRLAIQDLSPDGYQPMVSASGRSVIVFNGEIYNFKTIKTELISKGVVFSGESDTEVLLEAIGAWGVDKTLEMAIGMFAFCHIDLDSGLLTLARDRIGEKPLFYGVVGSAFCFVSELKALYEIYPASGLTLDYGSLDSYLKFGYFSAPGTVFKEIKRLPPGFKLELDTRSVSPLDSVRLAEFWSVRRVRNNASQEQYLSDDIAINDGNGLLSEIISEQSIADVSLGSFLSGGIDSTLTSAVLQSNSSIPIETFTIGFPQKEFDEAGYARDISKHLGTHHNELYIGPEELMGSLTKIPEIFDEPFADSSAIPMLLVSGFAKKHVTVCLSGDGGDELFCGYNRYFMGSSASRASNKLPKLVSTVISSAIKSMPPSLISNFYQLLKTALRSSGAANFGPKAHKLADILALRDPEKIYVYLSSYWQNPQDILLHKQGGQDMFTNFNFKDNFMAEAMLWDQLHYLPGDNLVKGDLSTMSNSLELRVPLLDKRFIEFAWKVPLSMKYRDGDSKWLLREMLYKHVPKKLIDRPKMGFSVPVSEWLRKDLRDWVDSYLSFDYLSKQQVFNAERVRKVLQEHLSGKKDHGNKLWTILMFQVWYDRYISKASQ